MPAECFFCTRINADGSRFCNECGEPLHLAPCPHCNAINDKVATKCHSCEAALHLRQARGRTNDATALVDAAAGSSALDEFSQDKERAPREPPSNQNLVETGAPPLQPQGLGSYPTATDSSNRVFGFVGSRRPHAALSKFRQHRATLIIIGISLAAVTYVGLYAYSFETAGLQPLGATQAPTALSSRHSAEDRQSSELTSPANPILGNDTGQEPPGAASAQPPQVAVDALFLQQSTSEARTEQQPVQSPPCNEAVAALGLCAVQDLQRK